MPPLIGSGYSFLREEIKIASFSFLDKRAWNIKAPGGSMLCELDIRAIVRLLGKLSILEGDLSQKRGHLLNELCELINGDSWIWSLHRREGKTGTDLCLDSISGRRPIVPLLKRDVTDSIIPQGSFHGRVLGQANGARLRLTVRQISDDVVSSLHIIRRAGRSAFVPREIKIAQIILSEIPWLHEQSSAIEVRPLRISLPPRQRATFVHLIDGLSRQAIAQRLRISPHTVHGYIKDIYKHYHVNSHAELIKQFTLGWQRGAE